jgi:pilus assembly protein Flp/PilA
MYHKSLHKQNEKGQGLVEYALILVLVAIVVIAALMLLGPIIGNVFSKVNSSLSGLGSGRAGGATSPSYPATIRVTGVSANDCAALGLTTGQQVNYYQCSDTLWYARGNSASPHCTPIQVGSPLVCP